MVLSQFISRRVGKQSICVVASLAFAAGLQSSIVPEATIKAGEPPLFEILKVAKQIPDHLVQVLGAPPGTGPPDLIQEFLGEVVPFVPVCEGDIHLRDPTEKFGCEKIEGHLVINNFMGPSVTDDHFPYLREVTDDLQFAYNPNLTLVRLPKLEIVGEKLRFFGNVALNEISFPMLRAASDLLTCFNKNLQTVKYPALKKLGNYWFDGDADKNVMSRITLQLRTAMCRASWRAVRALPAWEQAKAFASLPGCLASTAGEKIGDAIEDAIHSWKGWEHEPSLATECRQYDCTPKHFDPSQHLTTFSL